MQKALIQSNGTPANKEMQLAYLLTFVQREFLGYISAILPGARVVQHLDYAQLVQQPDYHPLLSVTHTQPDLCIAELYLKRLSGLLQQFNPGKTRLANIAHGYFDQLVAREYGTSVVYRTLRSGVVHAFAYTVLPRLLIYGAIKDQRVAVIARVLAVVYAALPTRSLIVVETLLLVAQAQPSGFQDLLVTWRSVVSDDLVLSCAAALGFDQGYQALTTVWQVEATRTPTAAMGCHLFFHCSAQFAQLIKPNQPLLIPVSE
ncbi:hypothetical protein H4R35_003503 [Dimargaris xerosporica]|nr:hypothetical protein H4R35_003503 [Dimargaris xerosporica]